MREHVQVILSAIGGLLVILLGALGILFVVYGLEWAWWLFTSLPRPQ